MSQYCFTRNVLKIFLENETLYPSDTVIKCTLCTALNIVL